MKQDILNLEEMMPIETRQTDSTASTIFFTLPNGKKCYIGPNDRDFFLQLCDLPFQTKIKLMRLTEEEMLSYIEEKNKSAIDFLKTLLDRRWYWRATGDRVIFSDLEIIPGMMLENIRRKIRSNKFTYKQATEAISFFTDENSEIYYKDETGEIVMAKEDDYE